MNKRLLTLALMMLMAVVGMAADIKVKGRIADKQTDDAIATASVRILTTDSTWVTGGSTDADGLFTLAVKKPGTYIVMASFISYHTAYKRITIEQDKPLDLGTIGLHINAVSLGEAEVRATLAKVEQKGDTTVFNAEAYRVPEGSTLEVLVKQLPGVEVDDEGTITWNGKTVTEFLTNGKDFFKGNTSIAMKNLPTSLVNKIKAYDRKSDYTQQTGIEDGEETTVLDLELKRELNETWFANVDLGVGSRKRYTEKLFINRFDDHSRITIFGSLNNTGDRGFMGGGGGFGNKSGLTAMKDLGIDFQWDNGKKRFEAGRFEIGGNVRYSYSDNDLISYTNSETFLSSDAGTSSFTYSRGSSSSRSYSLRGDLRLEWNPDSLTTISLRPSVSHTHGSSSGASLSATFNSDPTDLDTLYSLPDAMFATTLPTSLSAIAVNTNDKRTLGNSLSNSAEAELNVVRRLGTKGRNVSLQSKIGYKYSYSKSYSISDIRYYQSTAATPYTFTNQYSYSPSTTWNYSTRLSYTEPLGGNWYLQLRYEYEYKYTDGSRSLYQLDSLAGWGYGTNRAIGELPSTEDSLMMAYNARNSQNATYRNYNHEVGVSLNYNTANLNFQAGVELQPQTSKMEYTSGQVDTTITRNSLVFAPRLRLRYRINNTTQLQANYRGSASQPSLTNLLDVTDDSDPLNISKGNPGLKPSWTNSFEAVYNTYNATRQQGLMSSLRFSQTSNSISSSVLYDETTGVRTTKPENINGNWNASGDFTFNTPINRDKTWTVSTSSTLSYRNAVGYLSVNSGTSQKNTTRTFSVGERLSSNYRYDWYDVGVFGNVNYQHSRNKLQSSADLDTYTFSYGINTNMSLPWSISLSTDIAMNSRRGYSDDAMNTNELVWNAQLSKSFLKGNAATISIQFYDILHKQSNVSRVLNAQMRSDTWSNSINSYFMMHFIYRLNIISGTGGNSDSNNRRDNRGSRGNYSGQGFTPMMPAGDMGGGGGR